MRKNEILEVVVDESIGCVMMHDVRLSLEVVAVSISNVVSQFHSVEDTRSAAVVHLAH